MLGSAAVADVFGFFICVWVCGSGDCLDKRRRRQMSLVLLMAAAAATS
jgi:hypothetical protein